MVGMYQTNYDTVSCDIALAEGKITAVTLTKDSIKEGRNYLTFNTGTKIVLEEEYAVSDNFADPEDYKKAKKFVKKKKDGYVLDLKPLKSAKGGTYGKLLFAISPVPGLGRVPARSLFVGKKNRPRFPCRNFIEESPDMW